MICFRSKKNAPAGLLGSTKKKMMNGQYFSLFFLPSFFFLLFSSSSFVHAFSATSSSSTLSRIDTGKHSSRENSSKQQQQGDGNVKTMPLPTASTVKVETEVTSVRPPPPPTLLDTYKAFQDYLGSVETASTPTMATVDEEEADEKSKVPASVSAPAAAAETRGAAVEQQTTPLPSLSSPTRPTTAIAKLEKISDILAAALDTETVTAAAQLDEIGAILNAVVSTPTTTTTPAAAKGGNKQQKVRPSSLMPSETDKLEKIGAILEARKAALDTAGGGAAAAKAQLEEISAILAARTMTLDTRAAAAAAPAAPAPVAKAPAAKAKEQLLDNNTKGSFETKKGTIGSVKDVIPWTLKPQKRRFWWERNKLSGKIWVFHVETETTSTSSTTMLLPDTPLVTVTPPPQVRWVEKTFVDSSADYKEE